MTQLSTAVFKLYEALIEIGKANSDNPKVIAPNPKRYLLALSHSLLKIGAGGIVQCNGSAFSNPRRL